MTMRTEVSLRQQQRHDALAGQRQVANADAKRARYRVADRGGHWAGCCFADAERQVAIGFYKFNVDLRHLAETQDRIAVPIDGSGSRIVKPDLLLEHPACRLDHAAFELIDDGVWIDHKSGIGGAPRAAQAHGVLDLNCDDNRGIGGAVLILRKADAHTTIGLIAIRLWPSFLIPVRHRRRALDDAPSTRI